MKKFIAAFDGLDFSQGTLEYAIFMASSCEAHLVGIFLDDLTYHSYSFSQLVTQEGEVSDERLMQLNREDNNTRDRSAHLFETACTNAGISFSIHRDRNIAIQELLHESIYADLLIIDKNETFTRFEESIPTRFIRDLLTDVQCPVLIVPAKYKPIDKTALLYDGEPSSVYAVKMFSYMMPSLKNIEAEVISVRKDKEALHLPDNALMKEFMKRHFPKADYVIQNGDSEDRILSYLQQANANVLVVLGAYRRGRVSRWFKLSMADYLMKYSRSPLFIAHN